MNFNPRSREGSDRAASSNKEKRYQELLERALLGALTSDEQEEFERLSAERGSK